MVKEVYFCDVCEKEYPKESLQKMKFPFAKETEEGTSLELKELDCCLDCCFKLAVILKDQDFLHYEKPETTKEEPEQVEGEVVE